MWYDSLHGKVCFLHFPFRDSCSPGDGQELEKRENKISWVPGSPVLSPRAPWRDWGRPDLSRGSLHLTPEFLKSSSRTCSCHGPGSRASRDQEPQRQRAHVLGAGAEMGWVRKRRIRESFGTRSDWKQAPHQPWAASRLGLPGSLTVKCGSRGFQPRRCSPGTAVVGGREQS